MSLLNILRSGLKTANKITKPLQATVQYQPVVVSTDGLSTKTWPTTIPLTAIVDFKQRSVRGRSGEVAVSTTTLTFVDLDAVAKAAPNGFNFEDRFILPPYNNTEIVMNWDGFVDPGNGRLMPTTVYL